MFIEPQDADPTITFNKGTYEIGEVLEANCTTAPARPPPHITWLINGEKVGFECKLRCLVFKLRAFFVSGQI